MNSSEYADTGMERHEFSVPKGHSQQLLSIQRDVEEEVEFLLRYGLSPIRRDADVLDLLTADMQAVKSYMKAHFPDGEA